MHSIARAPNVRDTIERFRAAPFDVATKALSRIIPPLPNAAVQELVDAWVTAAETAADDEWERGNSDLPGIAEMCPERCASRMFGLFKRRRAATALLLRVLTRFLPQRS
jgi:hypothetical protein